MPSVARHVRVTGRVQGVYFRAWTRDEAERLGVNGWVRNLADGTVEAHLEGEDGVVDRLIGLMRTGPSGARVEHVRAEDARVNGLTSFEVRR